MKFGSRALQILLACVVLGSQHAAAFSQDPGVEATRDYQVGIGDVIRVSVHGEEDLGLETRIEEGGYFNYPFLGAVKAETLTVAELERVLEDGLRGDYLLTPEVQVSVVQYRPFFINGEINSPGSYPFQPGLTVQKAVAIAGGFTRLASKNRIFLKRENNDEQYSATVDTPMRPGDTLIIKESFF